MDVLSTGSNELCSSSSRLPSPQLNVYKCLSSHLSKNGGEDVHSPAQWPLVSFRPFTRNYKRSMKYEAPSGYGSTIVFFRETQLLSPVSLTQEGM